MSEIRFVTNVYPHFSRMSSAHSVCPALRGLFFTQKCLYSAKLLMRNAKSGQRIFSFPCLERELKIGKMGVNREKFALELVVLFLFG